MATSTVSKAVLLPSNDAAAAAVFSSKPSYLKFHGKTAAGRSYRSVGGRRIGMQVIAMSSPTPAKDNISEIVEESIKTAIETCADNETSGECAASWDTVEELSAMRSHMRTKDKAKDPLEEFCKDNPETDECRT
ncbi:hypothetical protein A7L55_20630, partial [Acinetobacter baumannii]